MENFLDTKAAAEYLHAQIPGESAKYWSARINNLRRTDRAQPFELRFAKVEGKSGFYRQVDLEQYVEFEKSRRLGKVKLSSRAAEALRAFGGHPQGRPFKGGSVYLLPPSETSSGVLVRLTIDEPLMVFAMTAEQAVEFGQELVDVGRVAQRHNNPQQPSAPEDDNFTMTTITDNADVLVQRRVYK